MNICARNGCEEKFTKKTHNQKYCSDECCRLATNERIMEKYYLRRDRRQGKTRYCNICEVTRLNRYNDSQICSSCKSKKEIAKNEAVANMFRNASLVS